MLNKRLNGRFLATTMLTGAAMAAAPAYAQDGDDEIIVTGSRIQNANIESSSPVTTIDAELFAIRGTVDTIDLVNQLPQAASGQDTSFANGANGTSTLSLRQLGAVRTLVLANGKRLPPGSPGAYAADINLIPAPLVERVEIVTGGASAVYGSDAVGGVANFILRRDFEGFEIDGLFGVNQSNNGSEDLQQALIDAGEDPVAGSQWDNPTYDISAIMGASLDGGRGNVTSYFRYFRNQGVNQSERDFAKCALGLFGSDPFCLGSNQGPFPTTFVVSPALTDPTDPTSAVPLVDAAGNVLIDDDGDPITSGAFSLQQDDSFNDGFTNAFNFNPDNPIRRSVERFNAGFSGFYKVTDDVEAYLDFGFTQSTSPQVIAPSAAFGSTINRVNCDNPLLTDDLLARICGTADPVTGIFSRDTDGDGFAQSNVRRRFVEGGGRTDERTLTNFRFVGGFKGKMAEHWDWDVFGQFGKTNLDRVQTNQVTLDNLQNALDIVSDPVTGNPVCRSVVDGTDPNCVPFISAYTFAIPVEAEALRQYVDTPTLTRGFTQQSVFGATAQADLGNYGIASPWAEDGINVLFGAEYRREQLSIQADATNSGGNLVGSGGRVNPTNGSTELYEFFFETAIPVIQGAQFAEELGISGAFRRSEYSSTDILNGADGGNFGTNTFSVGMTWSPVSDVRIRAQFQRAIRAPNVLELFAPRNTGLGSLTDPCSGFAGSATPPTETQAFCANTGVTAAQFGAIPPDSGQLNLRTGGNPDLRPEVADTFTVGAVVQPSAIEGLTVSVDYYNIDLSDAIGTVPATFTLEQCGDTGDSAFCDLIQRGPDGSLTFFPREQAFIDASAVNIAGLVREGIDGSIDYRYDLGAAGDMQFQYKATYQLASESTPLPSAGTFDCVGFFDQGCGNPDFTYRHNATLTYNTPWDVRASLLWRYLSSVERLDSIDGDTGETTTFAQAGNGDVVSATLPSRSYFDLALFWNATENLTLRAGVNNILDQDPPVLPPFGPSPTAGVEANTVAGVYDAAGRFIFVGANIRF